MSRRHDSTNYEHYQQVFDRRNARWDESCYHHTHFEKKSSLDSETLKSYRPISNMSFLSKLLERVVADRLIAHMRENYLYMSLQSAYRQNCSTEIALLHLHDIIIRSIDERKGVILLLIDLSSEFYTIDHAIFLNTLSNTIGVKDRCLSWFAAYLQHRQYTV